MDIISILAISFGLTAALLAILAHLWLPTDRVERFENETKRHARKLVNAIHDTEA